MVHSGFLKGSPDSKFSSLGFIQTLAGSQRHQRRGRAGGLYLLTRWYDQGAPSEAHLTRPSISICDC